MEEFNMTEEETLVSQAQESTTPKETISTPETPQSEQTYLVKERFEIDYNSPLPTLDTNGAKAFVVKDKINPQRELFALICDNNFPPRLSILPYLKSIDHPNLLKLIEYSVVNYIPQKTMNMALIYNRPTGPKVSSHKLSEKISGEKFKSLAMSIVSGCEILKTYNISHRAIRIDNIFYKDTEGSDIILGDCAASFPALYQPSSYETIESMLCLPQGRGNGSSSDDIYAAGVSLLEIVLQHEVAKDVSTVELLQQKIKKGSLSALTNGEKVNSQFLPLLKGMLEDSSDNRWSSLSIYSFLEGKSLSFSVNDSSDRSMRALSIGGEKYYSAKTAALAMLEKPEEALSIIKNGKLLDWVKNGLENEKLHSKLEKIITAEKEKGNEPNRFLVPQVCIYIDHTLPIKCGDFFVFPSGVSKAIYHYQKTHQNLESFFQLLSSDLIKIWYTEQPHLHAPTNSNEFRVYLARGDYGYGIDRIMYDFDNDLPCTSELVGKEFVNTPSKLLRALDNNYSLFKEKAPFDKNIIAYLRCKMGKKIDGILTDINFNQDALQIAAVIRLYANIQNKNGPVQLLNLAQWLMKAAKPIIMNYHNVKYRKFLEQELVKLSKNGKIIELYEILENDEAKQKDRYEYAEALKKINILMTERNRILSGSPKLDEEAKDLALRFASILSVLTMLATFVCSIIYWTLK